MLEPRAGIGARLLTYGRYSLSRWQSTTEQVFETASRCLRRKMAMTAFWWRGVRCMAPLRSTLVPWILLTTRNGIEGLRINPYQVKRQAERIALNLRLE
jgi:hypothetical protein